MQYGKDTILHVSFLKLGTDIFWNQKPWMVHLKGATRGVTKQWQMNPKAFLNNLLNTEEALN